MATAINRPNNDEATSLTIRPQGEALALMSVNEALCRCKQCLVRLRRQQRDGMET